MATNIQFYHLLSTRLEQAVPKLMQSALNANHRILLWCKDKAEEQRISDALWTQNPASFLPHGSATGAHATLQPIVLSAEESPANHPDLLAITHGAAPKNPDDYAKILDIFDGTNDDAVLAARERWKRYKGEGHKLQYIKQQPGGGWKVESESA